MMNAGLLMAAALLALTAAAHSILGERHILTRLFRRSLPPLFGSDWFTRRTLRFAWHLTSVAWLGFAALLVVLAGAFPVSSASLLRIVAVTFLLTSAVTAAASRGRHLAWPVFLAVALLAGWAAAAGSPPEQRPSDDDARRAEVRSVIDTIFRDAANADIAALEASHLADERFSKFGPRRFERQGVEDTNTSEAAFFGSITEYEHQVRDLKVDLFGEVAVATYHPRVSFVQDGQLRRGSGRQTFVFLSTENGWKLVHEHGTTRCQPCDEPGSGG